MYATEKKFMNSFTADRRFKICYVELGNIFRVLTYYLPRRTVTKTNIRVRHKESMVRYKCINLFKVYNNSIAFCFLSVLNTDIFTFTLHLKVMWTKVKMQL